MWNVRVYFIQTAWAVYNQSFNPKITLSLETWARQGCSGWCVGSPQSRLPWGKQVNHSNTLYQSIFTTRKETVVKGKEISKPIRSMKYEAICHLQQFCFKYEREFSTMAKINFFRHKLEKRREQCVALCHQQLSINSKSPSSSSTHSSSSSSSSRPPPSSSPPPPAAFPRASLGQASTQAPAFSNAVSLQYHPEKGRHGVRFWRVLVNL